MLYLLKINETKISSPEETSPRSSSPPVVIQDEVSEEEDKTNDINSIKLECPICYCELNTDVDSDDYTGCCVGHIAVMLYVNHVGMNIVG